MTHNDEEAIVLTDDETTAVALLIALRNLEAADVDARYIYGEIT